MLCTRYWAEYWVFSSEHKSSDPPGVYQQSSWLSFSLFFNQFSDRQVRVLTKQGLRQRFQCKWVYLWVHPRKLSEKMVNEIRKGREVGWKGICTQVAQWGLSPAGDPLGDCGTHLRHWPLEGTRMLRYSPTNSCPLWVETAPVIKLSGTLSVPCPQAQRIQADRCKNSGVFKNCLALLRAKVGHRQYLS